MKGLLDIEKLKEAVGRLGRIIPEIFYIYDFEQGIFIDKGFCADHVILEHLYNGKEVSESIKNQRAVSPYLKNINR